MATPLIGYPFRITAAGTVATFPEGSDDQLAQELAVAVLTKQGERMLVPSFGIADPTFVGFEEDALIMHIGLFGPPIEIDEVTTRFIDDDTQDVVVQFSS